MNQGPRGHGQRQQQPPVVNAAPNGECEQRDRNERQRQRAEREVVGVEDGDDGDGEQIVDDGKRQQEGAQRTRQVRGQHGQDRHCECDVGGDRHRPAVEVLGATGGEGDGDVDRGRHDHSADGRGDRQRRPPRIAQVSCDELPLEFETDHEEEDGEQPVGCPR